MKSFIADYKGDESELNELLLKKLQLGELSVGWSNHKLERNDGRLDCSKSGRGCVKASFLAGPIYDGEIEILNDAIRNNEVANYFDEISNWIDFIPGLSLEIETQNKLKNGQLGVSLLNYFDPRTDGILESTIVVIHEKPSGVSDVKLEDIVIGFPVIKVGFN